MAFDMYGDSESELSNQEKVAILFIALGPEYSAKLFQHLDDDEFIDVEVYTPDELKSLILEGKIVDAKTIAGLSTYLLKMSPAN